MISKPMLAHKFDINRVDYSQPVYIQPKLDGIRCLFTANGAFSRNKKQNLTFVKNAKFDPYISPYHPREEPM